MELETVKYEEQKKVMEAKRAAFEESKKFKEEEAAYRAAKKAEAQAKRDEAARVAGGTTGGVRAEKAEAQRQRWAEDYKKWEATGAGVAADRTRSPVEDSSPDATRF